MSWWIIKMSSYDLNASITLCFIPTCTLIRCHIKSFQRDFPSRLAAPEIRMEDPQEDPLAVHCFCVCSGSALLGDLLGVSRSREHDLLSVLFIYLRFLCVCSLCLVTFFVFVLFCYNLMHVRCFGLIVNTCTPLPFGRICFVVLVMRKGGEGSGSGPWHLGCTSEVSFSMCTATRTSSYSPVGSSVFYLA